MTIKNKPQLISYPDSLGGNLKTLNNILETDFKDLFKGGIHILPPFPSSADRGFAPLTYFKIEPKFGDWSDIVEIAKTHDIIVDQMVNHISRQSEYFQDFIKNGRDSKYAELFITLDKVWPGAKVAPEDLDKIFLRKPEHPFSDIRIEKTGKIERIWTSFGKSVDSSEQIDLDVNSEQGKQLLVDFLKHFAEKNIKIIRLDAIGYVIKKAATSCFFVEPEIYEFLDWIQKEANKLGLIILPEIHAHYKINHALSKRGFWAYDFVLPALILHTLFSKSASKFKNYLKTCPKNQITMLDCHDGIPIQPDMEDILTIAESKQIVETCLQRGANINRILTHDKKLDFDTHQINITYYSALNHNDNTYLSARALQFFTPGVPQVYYVGLLAGKNSKAEIDKQDEGRAINRYNYSSKEIAREIKRPVVKKLFELIRFRNEYEAFNGDFEVLTSKASIIILAWKKLKSYCKLTVDLDTMTSVIEYLDDNNQLVKLELSV